MQIFVPVKSNLNAIQLTAETTKSSLFCVGRPKKKKHMESDYWEAPQVGKHLLFLSCTIHKGNTMKLNFATHQKAVKK